MLIESYFHNMQLLFSNTKKRFRKDKIKCPGYVIRNSMVEEDTLIFSVLRRFWTNVMFLFKHAMITQLTAAQCYAGFIFFFVIKKYYLWLFYADCFTRVFPNILFIILFFFSATLCLCLWLLSFPHSLSWFFSGNGYFDF